MRKYIYSLVSIIGLTLLSCSNLVGMTQNGYGGDNLEQLFPELDDDYSDSYDVSVFISDGALSQKTQGQDVIAVAAKDRYEDTQDSDDDESEPEADDEPENDESDDDSESDSDDEDDKSEEVNHNLRICPYCSKSFDRPSNLIVHIRKHTGEKPYECSYKGCRKRFARTGDLNSHERTHLCIKFICPYEDCSQACSSEKNLKVHIKIHIGERSFVCPYEGCTSAFISPSRLSMHKRIHTREMYECTECGYSCTDKSAYNRHIKIHLTGRPYIQKTRLKRDESEKPYRCHFRGCDKAYTKNSSLSRHKEDKGHS